MLEHQRELRDQIENDPSEFLHFRLPTLLNHARNAVAEFVGAAPEGFAFVRSATDGLNAVLRSLPLATGDEILIADHAHHVCVAIAQTVAKLSKATVVTASLPDRPTSADELANSFLSAVTPRTRIAVVDHITSACGLILPVEHIVATLRARGIVSVVDGAHAPGMIELSVSGIAADYYVGSLHKWTCAPKGSGFIHTGEHEHSSLVPSVIARLGTYRERFDWPGTCDPTPWLSSPVAIEKVGNMMTGGWSAIRSRNRKLAQDGRDVLNEALRLTAMPSAQLLGSMFSIRVAPPEGCNLANDEAQLDFKSRYGIHVRFARPIRGDGWLIRASAFLYNELTDYRDLAAALLDFGVRPPSAT